MHIGSLSQTEAQSDPLGRKFFESSVYRNAFDMVTTLETRFNRFEKNVKNLFARSYLSDRRNLVKLVLGKTNIRAKTDKPAKIFIRKFFNAPNLVSAKDFDNKLFPLAKSVNPNTLNFLSNDILRDVINLERELNRIHIPMPGDFRAWTDKVRDLTNKITPFMIKNSYFGMAKHVWRLWDSIQEMEGWLNKIKKSIKKTELRAEELKKKQQEKAEKAYQKRLEEERKKKAAEEAVKQQKEKEKQAAEKVKQEAEKVATETGMSDTERQQAIQQAVTRAVSAQRAEFQALLEQLRAQAERASGTANGAEKDAAEKTATNGGQGQVNPAILALAAAAALVLMEGA